MHLEIRALLNELKTLVLSHSAVYLVQLRGEEVTNYRGYLRMRMVLRSQDTVEAFVYLVDDDQSLRLTDYSLHWQRRDGTFVQRWDTAPHHPELAGFPHHTHRVTGEVQSIPALDWSGFIALLQQEVLEADKRE